MSPPAPKLRLVTPDFVPVSGLPDWLPRPPPLRSRPARKPLGQILQDMKAVEPGDLLKAAALRSRQDVRLGDILLAHGWVTEAALMRALSLQWGVRIVDLAADAPDPRLIDRFGPEFCLKEGIIPWRKAGSPPRGPTPLRGCARGCPQRPARWSWRWRVNVPSMRRCWRRGAHR